MPETQSWSKNTKVEMARPIRPSAQLRSLVRCYFELVDGGQAGESKSATDQVREALLNAMQSERIPFNSPQEALWIARWLYAGEPLHRGKQTSIMFARTPPHVHESEYDPIRDGVRELTSVPYEGGEDERENGARRIPLLVTVEPLHDYVGATYERAD